MSKGVVAGEVMEGGAVKLQENDAYSNKVGQGRGERGTLLLLDGPMMSKPVM
jgi:hypothetical protein